MKILIVDDNPRHWESARSLEANHNVTFVDSYEMALRVIRKDEFDVVLSDLLMPVEKYTLGPKGMAFVGHEMAIGLIVALKAVQVGVKRVAVITEVNHHDHPMSAVIDFLNPAYWNGDEKAIDIGGSKLLVAHAPLDSEGRKDWVKVLEILIAADDVDDDGITI